MKVKLTPTGTRRVLDGKAGMVFEVFRTTPRPEPHTGVNAHVKDPRYPKPGSEAGSQIWTLGPDDYELVPD